MHPEVSQSHRGVPVWTAVTLVACLAIMIVTAERLRAQNDEHLQHLHQLERDLATERDLHRTQPAPSRIDMSTTATLSPECGRPDVVVYPGIASIAWPSACRVNVSTVCR